MAQKYAANHCAGSDIFYRTGAESFGAGDRDRTDDIQLGKLMRKM